MSGVNVVIGGTAIDVASADPGFVAMLREQYADFIGASTRSSIHLSVALLPEFTSADPDEDVSVSRTADTWTIRRGDFEASYDAVRRSAVVRQNANRHSIDSVIRIIHTLALATESGFLLHSASAIRNGRAFLFTGPSGAGKTTMSRLAPGNACLLSDEVSYVRKSGRRFLAWGTPFTGELGTPGANRSAPVKALYFLNKAPANRLVPIGEAESLRLLMMNVLFFAGDPALVESVFETASEFVASVPAFRFDFTRNAAAWELIQ